MKVAIVGSGISGLAAAHKLRHQAHVTLFEGGNYFGGHTHTVDITLPSSSGNQTWGVDTGFLVFNERTYPNLISLFAELDVKTAHSDMSFSVQVPGSKGGKSLEWSGNNLRTVFAQKRNLFNTKFLGMLKDLLRFNRLCTQLAKHGKESELAEPLLDFLNRHHFSQAFRNWYFLPMLGCIWSCPTDQMLKFPVATMIRFCHNHGLLQVNDRPQWHTVVGGARNYVEKIIADIPDARLNTPVMRIDRDAAGVVIHTNHGSERFDFVVIATHSDQSLAMLSQPTPLEHEVLSAIRYQDNLAVLHTDASVLPQRESAWAAWNYERAADEQQESTRVCLHYLLNKLQPLPFDQPVVESLNPIRPIDPAKILAQFEYSHPVFDLTAIEAQQRIPELQGNQRTWFCGAWTGYGFHEDGLKSGLAVAIDVLERTSSLRKAAA
ncbi:NAD(P)-binding protein [Orrella sp. NBD-18]|uniref:NAD(P)-binding protein n=1 Tax=Sheuella amnicola TaxID=2707330 RepID=A0A6B2QSV1_9BURK|nr:FAD-dependent oxidoreductase [Sheuella amnicola]NDY81776.1 NAD(P)-binding protein [Sheuella amnicola]